MKSSDLLSEFVRDALTQGASRDQIAQSLSHAGWSGPEIHDALHSWKVAPGLPPVPRPRPYASAQEALLYGLLFLSLGTVAWNITDLGMDLLDRLIPDPAAGRYPVGNGGLRWSIAALIVFTPLFLFLNRKVRRMAQNDAGRRRSLVRKWFASITMLIASLVFLGDGISIIHALLSGEMTGRFAAKAVLVASVAALAFAYYRDELNEE